MPEHEEIQPGTYAYPPEFALPVRHDAATVSEWNRRFQDQKNRLSVSSEQCSDEKVVNGVFFSAVCAALVGYLTAAGGGALAGVWGAALASAIGSAIGAVYGFAWGVRQSNTRDSVINAIEPLFQEPSPHLSHVLLPDRLRWARDQMGLSARALSERCGVPFHWVEALETGKAILPSVSMLTQLAASLGVTTAFLVGEIPSPEANQGDASASTGKAWEIGHEFISYLSRLEPVDQELLRMGNVEERFATVVAFLCSTYPKTFTRAVVAYQLGVNVITINEILDDGAQVGPFLMQRTSEITGIPISFFCTGELADSHTANRVLAADAIAYLTAIQAAMDKNYNPNALTALIQGQERQQ